MCVGARVRAFMVGFRPLGPGPVVPKSAVRVCHELGHEWGPVVRGAAFDQRCQRCGVWRSGYGSRRV